ncbi:LppA family lipoprotein [Rhodococcus sp. HNM0569]|uniref:LppA family lipoprotein n=1 Tax=Rhodococcus sp. HNM0569 TaxID=2716340 RepID=UPI003211CF90
MTKNPYEATGEQDTAAAAQRLTELPTLEATESHAQRIAEELGAYITTLAPHLQWEWKRSRTQSGCHRPYDQTEGKLVALPAYVAQDPIPESVWPRVVERARALAETLGATELETFHDEPGNRDLRYYSREGTAVRFLNLDNAVISADTGCRLPEAVANRTPLPPPTP